jgi:hypothetical protein
VIHIDNGNETILKCYDEREHIISIVEADVDSWRYNNRSEVEFVFTIDQVAILDRARRIGGIESGRHFESVLVFTSFQRIRMLRYAAEGRSSDGR